MIIIPLQTSHQYKLEEAILYILIKEKKALTARQIFEQIQKMSSYSKKTSIRVIRKNLTSLQQKRIIHKRKTVSYYTFFVNKNQLRKGIQFTREYLGIRVLN